MTDDSKRFVILGQMVMMQAHTRLMKNQLTTFEKNLDSTLYSSVSTGNTTSLYSENLESTLAELDASIVKLRSLYSQIRQNDYQASKDALSSTDLDTK